MRPAAVRYRAAARRAYRVLFAAAVKWLSGFCLKSASTVRVWLPGCRPYRGARVREWLVRRAGVRGVSRPRWSRSRSPVALPGPSRWPLPGSPGVGQETGVDGIADPPLEGPERFFVRLTLGYFLVVAGAAVAVLVPDLGDRGHVDRVVDAAVAARRQAVDLAVPGGHLGRGGAVIGGEVVAAGEAGHVGDVADDGAGDDRAGAGHPGEGGTGGADRGGGLLAGVAQLGIQAAHVLQEPRGQLGAGPVNSS